MNSSKSKKSKKWLVIILVILGVIGGIFGVVALNAKKNTKVMDDTVESGMKTLSEYANVTPVDPGEYKNIKLNGMMNFDVSQYDVENIGNLSVMKVNMGFMQMASYVITPYEKNLPLLSMDFMYIMGKRKSYVEFYDLVENTSSEDYVQTMDLLHEFEDKYSSFEEIPSESVWYDKYLTIAMHKSAKNTDDEEIEQMFCDAVSYYMDSADKLEILDEAEKQEKLDLTREYSQGLVTNGGVSTDVFKKNLGEEKTQDFFDKVFFGTDRASAT